MRGAVCIAALCLLVLLPFAGRAAAEQLIATVAPDRIKISSNYGGGSIVVFGAVQADRTPPRPYDVVTTIIGPSQTVVVRRKQRVAGIWINADSHTFNDVPSFLAVLANRPLDAIASAATLRDQQIGPRNMLLARTNMAEDNSYLANLLHIRMDERSYAEKPTAVTFLSSTMFRAEVPLPANVSTGAYDVDLKLFSDGAVVAQTTATFSVVKVGVEELVVKAAVENALIYGLATAVMALSTGWLASIAFRKD